MKRGFAWSVTVHAVLIALLILSDLRGGGSGSGDADEAKEGTPGALPSMIAVEIVPPPGKVKEEAVELSEKQKLLAKAPHASDQCPDFFGGIGIMQTFVNTYQGYAAIVDVVYPGYPAERAGILPGDEIVNSSEVRGQIGTTVVVRILRKGRLINIDVVRDKICTEKAKEPQGSGQ